jgi:hypothetical protein
MRPAGRCSGVSGHRSPNGHPAGVSVPSAPLPCGRLSGKIFPAPWPGWVAISIPAEPVLILTALLLQEELEHARPWQPICQRGAGRADLRHGDRAVLARGMPGGGQPLPPARAARVVHERRLPHRVRYGTREPALPWRRPAVTDTSGVATSWPGIPMPVCSRRATAHSPGRPAKMGRDRPPSTLGAA